MRLAEPVPVEFSAGLHMADCRLDSAASPDHHARAKVTDLHLVDDDTLAAAVHDHDHDFLFGIAQDPPLTPVPPPARVFPSCTNIK